MPEKLWEALRLVRDFCKSRKMCQENETDGKECALLMWCKGCTSKDDPAWWELPDSPKPAPVCGATGLACCYCQPVCGSRKEASE